MSSDPNNPSQPPSAKTESALQQSEVRHNRRGRIYVRVKSILAQFWIADDMPDVERALLLEGWLDVLEPCMDDEIRAAWVEYQRNGPRSAKGVLIRPDPGALWQIIRTTRNFQAMATRQASRDLEKPTTVRREEQPATKEQREAILARVYGKKMDKVTE